MPVYADRKAIVTPGTPKVLSDVPLKLFKVIFEAVKTNNIDGEIRLAGPAVSLSTAHVTLYRGDKLILEGPNHIDLAEWFIDGDYVGDAIDIVSGGVVS